MHRLIFRQAMWMASGLMALLVTPAWVDAQQAAPSTFSETVDVRVIDLEVVVTDGKQRVTGLSPEDFRLRVDGKVVAIDYFTEVEGGKARPRQGAALGQAPQAAAGQRVPINYLVFVDRFFSFEPQQRQLLESLAENLPLLSGEDQMAVVAYSGHDIETVSGWTTSRPQLQKALQDVLKGPFGGIERFWEQFGFESERATRQAFIAEGDDPFLEGIDDGEDPGLQSRKKSLERQVDWMSRAVTASMQGLAAPQGRKALLLFSGGIPLDSVAYVNGSGASGAFGNPFSETDRSLQRIVSTANLLGYTIYAADVPVNRIGGNELEQHASLDFLAEKTGGQAFKNASGLQALPEAIQDTDAYYWMGFTPPWVGDGDTHQVEVDVLRPGLEVRHRTLFRDVPQTEQINELVQSATLLGTLPSSDPLGLTLGEVQPLKRKKIQVPLSIAIPLTSVVMLPSASGLTANLEIRISALDADGASNEISVIPFTFSGSRYPQAGDTMYYDTQLQMRKTTHDLVVVVNDLVSGALISGRVELTAP